MTSHLRPTILESALLDEFHVLYAKDGFPGPQHISVVSRENTGGGRYVRLSSDASSALGSTYLDLGGKFIEIDGVPNGMMAVIRTEDGRPTTLEITVYGGDAWDGVEREWKIR